MIIQFVQVSFHFALSYFETNFKICVVLVKNQSFDRLKSFLFKLSQAADSIRVVFVIT